jgi:hypothetical protein
MISVCILPAKATFLTHQMLLVRQMDIEGNSGVIHDLFKSFAGKKD